MTDTPTSEEERREAKVVSRHLPLGHSAEPDVDHGNAAASAPSLMQPRQESSKLLGDNVHHGPWVNLTRPGHFRGAARVPEERRSAAMLSTTKSFFTLPKAFIGTGIMFLPKAFNNGGILFSSITLVIVSLLSCVCFHLLLQCRKRYGGGYGDLGEAIGGQKLRSLILVSTG